MNGMRQSRVGRRLQLFTGWALLVGAAGIFIDAWAGWALDTDGSLGLIPAYLGFTTGMIGFVLVAWKTAGPWPGLLTGVGTVGMFVFWGSYPDYSTIGGLGGILVGIAVLWLPGWARVTSPLWVASGLMGITELVRPGVGWGAVSRFTLHGTAVAVTGAYVLWGLSTKDEPVPRAVEPATQTSD
jgi:hypothetical protein